MDCISDTVFEIAIELRVIMENWPITRRLAQAAAYVEGTEPPCHFTRWSKILMAAPVYCFALLGCLATDLL